ncbi:hypothetical protein D6D01_04737 [Aureobasidium pullulans]|uniref:Uncharacterized protein n=1 Tax=Aureobasidium pullulans TaxID=5580 RepID=A0A4S9LA57_AURPU|nr:hypothetical protein D6D01_04737 [Aureobasidium pullulans]
MSGLEVAGLVLAVMPLFISAFEHYETALYRTHRFFGYKEEVCRYRIRLLTQYAAFSQTLEYLLADFIDEAELDDMIVHGYSELWKNPDLTTKLKSRLGTVYEPFRQALTEMRHDMEQLATVLDIERKERAHNSNDWWSTISQSRPSHDSLLNRFYTSTTSRKG